MRFKWERCEAYRGEINAHTLDNRARVIGWIETRDGGFTPCICRWDNPSEVEDIRYPTERAAMRALRNEYAVYLMQPKEDDDE